MRNILIFFTVFLLVSIVLIPAKSVSANPGVSVSKQSSANDLIAEVNTLRAANGLPAYTESSILMGTAQGQAAYMSATGSITHSGPGGIQLTQRLLNAGYPLAGDLSLGGFRAENITGGTNKTAAQAVLEWQGDAPHLNTMLSPNLMEIGAGVAKVGSIYYMVIDCARPTTGGQPQPYTPDPNNPAAGTPAPSDFILPIITSTPDQDGLVYHEGQYGQTLWAIAIEYGVTIDEIRALNNLGAGTEIYQGDKLLVRKDALSFSATVTISPVSMPESSPTSLTFPTAFSVATRTPALDTTAIPDLISTPTSPINNPGNESTSLIGIAIGIALVAIFLAGMFTRMSTHKPVE